MYTLYYSPGSASMVVHLALLEIGVPYRLEIVDFGAGAQRDRSYLALNPEGVVPTLMIDSRPVTESAALLMVLADRRRLAVCSARHGINGSSISAIPWRPPIDFGSIRLTSVRKSTLLMCATRCSARSKVHGIASKPKLPRVAPICLAASFPVRIYC